MVRQIIIIILLISSFCVIPSITAENANHGFVLNNSVRPGDDFFSFVNDAWITEHPIPTDKISYSGLTELRDKVDDDLHALFEKAANTTLEDADRNVSLIGVFYRSGMDIETINREGILSLTDDLTMISAISTRDDLTKAIVSLLKNGFGPVYSYSADINPRKSDEMIATFEQGGLGLPDCDYFLRNDSKSLEIQNAYGRHITRIFILMGEPPEQAAIYARTVYEMEKILASAHFSQKENRVPQNTTNLFAFSDLKEQFPVVGWETLKAIPGSGPVTQVNIHQPRYVKELNNLLETAPIEDWKTYLRYQLVNSASPFLSSPFEEENFAFYSKTLDGVEDMKPRWNRVVQTGNNLLGDLVGRVYVSEYVNPKTREMVSTLFHSIRKTLGERISNLTWMSESTKKEAHEKLDAMGEKIAYPDRWMDYSGLNLSDSYISNVRNASAYNFLHGPGGLDKIGKTIDRSIWFISPQMVNAFYDLTRNEMIFPAGILQPPFFDVDNDASQNYDALGAVIGHEMTHGFDVEGRQYDKDGNLKDWWTKEDARNYTERVDLLVTQYNTFEVLPGLYINGNLTLGENIADFGGLTLAYQAWKKSLKEPLNPILSQDTQDRQFFFGFAQLWRSNNRDDDLRNWVYTDPHTPNKFRVNGVLFNIPEFYEVFPEIKPGDTLYRSLDERPIIW